MIGGRGNNAEKLEAFDADGSDFFPKKDRPNMGPEGTEADFFAVSSDRVKPLGETTDKLNMDEIIETIAWSDADASSQTEDSVSDLASEFIDPDATVPPKQTYIDRMDGEALERYRDRILSRHVALLRGRVSFEKVPTTRSIVNSVGKVIEVTNLGINESGFLTGIPEEVRFNDQSYKVAKAVGSGGFGAVVNVEPVFPADVVGGRSAVEEGDEAPSRVIKFIPLKDTEVLQDDNAFIRMIANEIDANDLEGAYVNGKVLQNEEGQMVYALLLEKGTGKSLAELHDEEPERFDTGAGKLQLVKAAGAIVRQLRMMKKRGWLHRDVKPGNILIDLDHPELSKLVDHGLAEERDPIRPKGDKDKHFAGSVRYTPEESIRGQDKDLSMRDVYGLALSLGLSAHHFERDKKATDVVIMHASHSSDSSVRRVIAPLDMKDEDSREGFLRQRYTRRPERDMVELIYDVVRPHDNEAQRLKYWKENGIDSEWFSQRVESIASEMEHVMQAESFLLIHDEGVHDRVVSPKDWQIKNIKEALNGYNAAKNEDIASRYYMKLVGALDDVGYDKVLAEHPQAIQEQIAKARKIEGEAIVRQKELAGRSAKTYSRSDRRLKRIEEDRLEKEKKKKIRLPEELVTQQYGLIRDEGDSREMSRIRRMEAESDDVDDSIFRKSGRLRRKDS